MAMVSRVSVRVELSVKLTARDVALVDDCLGRSGLTSRSAVSARSTSCDSRICRRTTPPRGRSGRPPGMATWESMVADGTANAPR
jgi:hypothetical protein